MISPTQQTLCIDDFHFPIDRNHSLSSNDALLCGSICCIYCIRHHHNAVSTTTLHDVVLFRRPLAFQTKVEGTIDGIVARNVYVQLVVLQQADHFGTGVEYRAIPMCRMNA